MPGYAREPAGAYGLNASTHVCLAYYNTVCNNLCIVASGGLKGGKAPG